MISDQGGAIKSQRDGRVTSELEGARGSGAVGPPGGAALGKAVGFGREVGGGHSGCLRGEPTRAWV